MDDLILRLKQQGIGCHILNIFVACLLYADDMCLIAPSRGALQELLRICEDYCKEFCLSFNVKKSKSLIFGNTKVFSLILLFLTQSLLSLFHNGLT